MEAARTPVEARHQALLDAIPDLMFRLSRQGEYLELAGDVTRLALPPADVLGSTLGAVLPEPVANAFQDAITRALDTGELTTTDYRLRTVDGSLKDFEARIAPCGEDEVVAIVRDVTDVREAMRELTESRARLVAAGDAERRRIERNLHDGAQQRLVTVALHLHLMRRRLENDPAQLPALVEGAQAELTLALEEIRELVQGLHPRVLSERGLGPALEAVAERSLLPVELVQLPRERLPAGVEAAAYYIVCEALANAAKHSEASAVTVRVQREGTHTLVEVVDDGVGGADPNGSGLRGLSDRVAALGGAFLVSSEPGRGTALRADLPHE
ncbi:MAG TPA: histidine kinase [Gaiellaceae bacterium]